MGTTDRHGTRRRRIALGVLFAFVASVASAAVAPHCPPAPHHASAASHDHAAPNGHDHGAPAEHDKAPCSIAVFASDTPAVMATVAAKDAPAFAVMRALPANTLMPLAPAPPQRATRPPIRSRGSAFDAAFARTTRILV